GPVYIRTLRGEIPRLFPSSEPMQFGKARVVSEGTDLVLLTSGICTEEAIRASQALKSRGVSIHHMHISTLKPFNDDSVLEAIKKSKYGVITMENHSIIGGLGTIIAEKMAEQGIGKKLTRIGIKDTFVHGASKQYLMQEYGLDAAALIRKIENITGKNLDIKEEELTEAHIVEVHSKAKAEAL
ncbi:MAG: transketolase C-terminal domain-containing protein, partial [Clostridiaceae bacterium]